MEPNHSAASTASDLGYADAVSLKGAVLNNCLGFIDGTVRQICRPGDYQNAIYHGHKHVHASKFQRTRGLGELGREDVGTRRRAGIRGRDKQITPDFCAELVKYNF